jgi:hypothetical protein
MAGRGSEGCEFDDGVVFVGCDWTTVGVEE